jgi:hypothetical protein
MVLLLASSWRGVVVHGYEAGEFAVPAGEREREREKFG